MTEGRARGNTKMPRNNFHAPEQHPVVYGGMLDPLKKITALKVSSCLFYLGDR